MSGISPQLTQFILSHCNKDGVHELLKYQSSPRCVELFLTPVSKLGENAIHVMAKNGETEALRMVFKELKLAQKKELLNGTSRNLGYTALHYASENGHLESVEELLKQCEKSDREAYISKLSSLGKKAAIHVACDRKINPQLVSRLLEGAPSQVFQKDIYQRTPLHYLALKKEDMGQRLKVIEILFSKMTAEQICENIYYVSENGASPFKFACGAKLLPIIEAFFNHTPAEMRLEKALEGLNLIQDEPLRAERHLEKIRLAQGKKECQEFFVQQLPEEALELIALDTL